MAEKGSVHSTHLDSSSINYQYNYLCLIKMLCRQGLGISILHCIPHQEMQLGNLTKEDKCQFALLDPLIVHQSGKGMTQDKQRIYLHGGAGLSHPYKRFICLGA